MDTALITLEGGDGAPVALPESFAPEPAAPEPVAAEPEPAAPAEPVVAAPAEPVEPAEDPADPRYSGVLKDLKHTRQSLGALKAEKAAQDAEIKAARELAQVLSTRPDVMAMLRGQPAAPVAPAAPKAPEPPAVPEAELRDLAESLGLYTAEGKPDTAAAGRVHAHNERMTARVVQQAVREAVAPLHAQHTNATAQTVRQEAVDTAAKLGLDASIAAGIFDNLAPEQMANPQAATTALLLAAGMQYVRQRNGQAPTPAAPVVAAPAAPAAPATIVVSDDGRPSGGPATMSVIEQQAAKRAGVKPGAWQSVMGSLTNSRPNSKPGEGFFQLEGDE